MRRLVVLKTLLGLSILFSLCASAWAQSRLVTIAGGVVKDGGPATSAALMSPRFAVYDKQSNLYIADYGAHRIRKVTAAGTISTFAGNGISGYSGDGGSAKSAMISFPTGIAVDAAGNVVFSDSGNNRIRSISTTGVITTIVGTGTAGFGGDGGPATSAMLNQPWGLWFDTAGNLYIADGLNQRVREVTAGIISTIAGNGTTGFGGDGGSALQASFNLPMAIVGDGQKNLYISDFYNLRVRKVTTAGTISTFAGNGTAGCTGDGGPGASAAIGNPGGLLVKTGSLLIATSGCSKIRSAVLTTGIISSNAGSTPGYDGDGKSPSATQFQLPRAVLADRGGNIVYVDTGNNRIRKLTTTTQLVSTIAGGFIGDGSAGTLTALNTPTQVGFDSNQIAYIADSLNNRVRKVPQVGNVTTYAGTGISGYSGDGGAATAAQLNNPLGLAVDLTGNIFISDGAGTIVRKIDTAGIITTVAQSGGTANFTLVNISVDVSDNVFGADPINCVVWKITPAGAVSTVAGIQGSCGYNSDGILATNALLNSPTGVTVDNKGNLYIGDSSNNRVRLVTKTTGIITTYAGTGTCGFSGDGGPATSAMLCNPGATNNYKGTVFIADVNNLRARSINPTGTITTIVGTGLPGYNGNDLIATQSNMDFPSAVLANKIGFIYTLDAGQGRLREIK